MCGLEAHWGSITGCWRWEKAASRYQKLAKRVVICSVTCLTLHLMQCAWLSCVLHEQTHLPGSTFPMHCSAQHGKQPCLGDRRVKPLGDCTQ